MTVFDNVIKFVIASGLFHLFRALQKSRLRALDKPKAYNALRVKVFPGADTYLVDCSSVQVILPKHSTSLHRCWKCYSCRKEAFGIKKVSVQLSS